MSGPLGTFVANVRTCAPTEVGRHVTVIAASPPGVRSNVTGPPTRVAASQISSIAPVARFVPRLWTVTRTETSLFTTGAVVNWTSADEIARSGQVYKVKVRAKRLFVSSVSRTRPPSVTARTGGSTTAEIARLDSSAPSGCQTIEPVAVPFFGTSAITRSAIQRPVAR